MQRNPRTAKYRLLKLGLWGGNRILCWALHHDLAPSAFALLETVAPVDHRRLPLHET